MRTKLKNRDGERTVFRGIFVRYGKKRGWKGAEETTILLQNIVDINGNLVCDHLWFNCTKEFANLSLKEGDRLEFHARVKKYTKGYQGRREDVYKPTEVDYKLSYPTRVRKEQNNATG